jgi:hypothetical protein
MNPSQALITGFRKTFDYRGRAGRYEFWCWNLFVLFSTIAVGVILPAAASVVVLCCLPSSLSLQVRRIHDSGHSGWWCVVPLVGWWFCLRRSNLDSSQWGVPPRKSFGETAHEASFNTGEKVVFAQSDRNTRPFILDKSDFSDTNLNGCDFSGSSLLDSDFSRAIQVSSNDEEQTRPVQFFGCDLVGARFVGCDLPGANFSISDLRGADFSGANLINADFRGADLSKANFQDSNLKGADFLGSKLSDAKFTGAYIAMSVSMSMALEGHEFA